MTLQIVEDKEYQVWLKELKIRIQSSQIEAAIQESTTVDSLLGTRPGNFTKRKTLQLGRCPNKSALFGFTSDQVILASIVLYLIISIQN
jgi:hypothetical protein